MSNLTVFQLAGVLQVQSGQTIVYESSQREVVRTVTYDELDKGINLLKEDDPFGNYGIRNILWNKKKIVITLDV